MHVSKLGLGLFESFTFSLDVELGTEFYSDNYFLYSCVFVASGNGVLP